MGWLDATSRFPLLGNVPVRGDASKFHAPADFPLSGDGVERLHRSRFITAMLDGRSRRTPSVRGILTAKRERRRALSRRKLAFALPVRAHGEKRGGKRGREKKCCGPVHWLVGKNRVAVQSSDREKNVSRSSPLVGEKNRAAVQSSHGEKNCEAVQSIGNLPSTL